MATALPAVSPSVREMMRKLVEEARIPLAFVAAWCGVSERAAHEWRRGGFIRAGHREQLEILYRVHFPA